MIYKFFTWSQEQEQPFGIIAFIIIGTFACITGLIFPLLLIDYLTEDRGDK